MMKKIFIFVVSLLLFKESEAQFLESVIKQKLDIYNCFDLKIYKTGIWVEKEGGIIKMGEYLENKKSGVWIIADNADRLNSILIYKEDTIMLNLNFLSSEIKIVNCDSSFFKIKKDLFCMQLNDDSTFSNLDSCIGLTFAHSVKNGLSINIFAGDQISLSLPNGEDKFIYIKFKRSSVGSNAYWILRHIFEINNSLLDHEHYEFQGLDTAQLFSVINYNAGWLDGTSLLFDKSYEPKIVVFDKGKLMNNKKTRKNKNMEMYFFISKKYVYSTFNETDFTHVNKPFANIKSNSNYYFSGYRGSIGTREDYESIFEDFNNRLFKDDLKSMKDALNRQNSW